MTVAVEMTPLNSVMVGLQGRVPLVHSKTVAFHASTLAMMLKFTGLDGALAFCTPKRAVVVAALSSATRRLAVLMGKRGFLPIRIRAFPNTCPARLPTGRRKAPSYLSLAVTAATQPCS